MPMVRFLAAFDFEQQYGVTVAYPAGYEGMVTTACFDAAGGRAVRISGSRGLKETINALRKAARTVNRGTARGH
jgi:hypothetical protein